MNTNNTSIATLQEVSVAIDKLKAIAIEIDSNMHKCSLITYAQLTDMILDGLTNIQSRIKPKGNNNENI